MPKFFIDLHDGSDLIRDDQGFDLPDLAAARGKVLKIMSRIAQEFSPDLAQQDFVAAVRDKKGKVVLRARLSLVVEEAGK